MLYDALKAVHVVGVVILVGNVTVTAFWKVFADRTADPGVVAFGQRLVTLTDWIFTVGGIVLIVGGGYGAALVAGLDLFGPAWLTWGQGLFALSGCLWLGILVPAQIRLARQARAFTAGEPIPEAYWRLCRRWLTWGIIATVPLVAAVVVMIVKP